MRLSNLKDHHRGWYLTACDDSLYNVDYEVAIQRYVKGQKHDKHYHKEAIEINVVTSGECIFTFYDKDNPKKVKEYVILKQDDILVIEPFEIVVFKANTDCCLTVVKTKSVKGDKYIVK